MGRPFGGLAFSRIKKPRHIGRGLVVKQVVLPRFLLQIIPTNTARRTSIWVNASESAFITYVSGGVLGGGGMHSILGGRWVQRLALQLPGRLCRTNSQ